MEMSPAQLFNVAAELALENRMQGHVIAQLTARVAELERAASTAGDDETAHPDPGTRPAAKTTAHEASGSEAPPPQPGAAD